MYYSIDSLKQLNKNNVYEKLYEMVNERNFLVFYINKCSECNTSNVSIFVESKHEDNLINVYAYFVCQSCGKKYRKKVVALGDKSTEGYLMKQYLLETFELKGNNKKYKGLQITDNMAVLFGKKRMQKFNMKDLRITQQKIIT